MGPSDEDDEDITAEWNKEMERMGHKSRFSARGTTKRPEFDSRNAYSSSNQKPKATAAKHENIRKAYAPPRSAHQERQTRWKKTQSDWYKTQKEKYNKQLEEEGFAILERVQRQQLNGVISTQWKAYDTRWQGFEARYSVHHKDNCNGGVSRRPQTATAARYLLFFFSVGRQGEMVIGFICVPN